MCSIKTSWLLCICICVCLSALALARPQQNNFNPFLPQQQQQQQQQRPQRPNRPGTTITTPAPPASSTTVPSPEYLTCLRNCPSTSEYNPVCGSDTLNYHNAARLECAVRCGQNVALVRMGTCQPL